MTYPAVLFWLAAIWAMTSRGPGLYYLFFFSWSFGTLAVIPPQLAGGNFTPAWVVAGLLTIRVVSDVGLERYARTLIDPRRFGLLSLSTFYAVASAVFLPRFFEGQVKVVEMRLLKTADPVPLEPGLANFNQTMYFVLTTLIIVNVYFVCADRSKRESFLKAFGWGAALAVVTGLADLVASKAGLGSLLAPFRNAAYVMMLDNDAMNMHRIVGLMSEASSYAALCLPFLSLILLAPTDASPWGRWSRPLGLALVAMTYLSTSSSGYVSLGAVAIALGMSLMIGVVLGRRPAWMGVYGGLIAVTAVLGVALLMPQLIAAFYNVIDLMVLHKTSSDSYVSRSAWNAAAYQAFLGTHLLGAGSGSARASSWPLALLANIGLPGTLSLVGFMLQVVFARPADPSDRLLARAAKLGLLPNLLMLSLSGTSMAIGAGTAMLFGVIAGLGWPELSGAAVRAPSLKRREQIAGVFVESALHAAFLCTAKPVLDTNPPRAPQGLAGPQTSVTSRIAPPGLDRRLAAYMRRLDHAAPSGAYVHMLIYTDLLNPCPSLSAWMEQHPHWSYESARFPRISTSQWLNAVSRYLTPAEAKGLFGARTGDSTGLYWFNRNLGDAATPARRSAEPGVNLPQHSAA